MAPANAVADAMIIVVAAGAWPLRSMNGVIATTAVPRAAVETNYQTVSAPNAAISGSGVATRSASIRP